MDQADFRVFYEKTAPRLRAYIARSCGSIDTADDILQEVFLRFLRNAPEIDEPNMRAYLYRTADSLIVDHWRHGQRERKYLELFVPSRPTEHEDGSDVKRAFGQLKPQQRSLLWLAYVEGFNHQEIAAAAGIKEKSVRVLLFRARRALTAILSRAGRGSELA